MRELSPSAQGALTDLITAGGKGTGASASGFSSHAILVAILVVIGLVIVYRISLRLRPYTSCRKCDGTGQLRGWLFQRARAYCPDCDGTGLVPRLGTWLQPRDRRPPMPKGPLR